LITRSVAKVRGRDRERGGRKASFQPARRVPRIPLKTNLSAEAQAEQFLREFDVECPGRCRLDERLAVVREELARTGVWHKTPEELGFAAQVAWRNAERCVGRLYWKGLHLRRLSKPEQPGSDR
jgi:nitric-oxide synthase